MSDWSPTTWKQTARKAINIYELHLEAEMANENPNNDFITFFLAQIDFLEALLQEPYNPQLGSVVRILEKFAEQQKVCYAGFRLNL